MLVGGEGAAARLGVVVAGVPTGGRWVAMLAGCGDVNTPTHTTASHPPHAVCVHPRTQVFLSIATNCLLFALASNQMAEYFPWWFHDMGDGRDLMREGAGRKIVGLAWGIEHAVVVLALFVWFAVDSKPEWVRVEMAKAEHEANAAKRQACVLLLRCVWAWLWWACGCGSCGCVVAVCCVVAVGGDVCAGVRRPAHRVWLWDAD